MINLQTDYLGMTLRNPIIVSSSGLTDSVDKIRKLEDVGAGAVVIKSLFEEQISYEAGVLYEDGIYPEANDYVMNYAKSHSVESYLRLLENAKKQVSIPVIASINCVSSSEWTNFAREIENAGADALELNIFFVAHDLNKPSASYETLYTEIVTKIKQFTRIPIAVKIGYYFTNLTSLIHHLHSRGVNGIVMFNRFFAPDIDIENMKLISSSVFSSENDIRQSLRWVGIISGKLKDIDIAASTGIHDSKAVVKQLLAGAKAVQICSVLYQKGLEQIPVILKGIEEWMAMKHFSNIPDFRGIMNYGKIPDPAMYERSQFMKYFSSYQ